MNFKKRMAAAMKHAGDLSVAEVARRVSDIVEEKKKREKGVATQTIQRLKNGTKNSHYVPHVAHVLGVSAIWLAEEVGDMIPESAGLHIIDGTVCDTYLGLPPDAKHHIQGVIEVCDKLAHPAKDAQIEKLKTEMDGNGAKSA